MFQKLRTFTNKADTTYNPARTSTIFAEDMNKITTNTNYTKQRVGVFNAFLAWFRKKFLMTQWQGIGVSAPTVYYGSAYSPELGLYVLVGSYINGYNGAISSDGFTWIDYVFAGIVNLKSIVWARELGLFVACGSDGAENFFCWSPNGIDWDYSYCEVGNYPCSIAWAPELGLFVAVGSYAEGANTFYSTDGQSWVRPDTLIDHDYTCVAYAPDLQRFVATSTYSTAQTISYSDNGIDWNLTNTPSYYILESVCYSLELGRFVAIGYSGGTNDVIYSDNGIDWTIAQTPILGQWKSVAWSATFGCFIACCIPDSTLLLMFSIDGQTWVPFDNAPVINAHRLFPVDIQGIVYALSQDNSGEFAIRSLKFDLY